MVAGPVIETCGNWFGPLTRNDFFAAKKRGMVQMLLRRVLPSESQRRSGRFNEAAAGHGRLLERV